MTLKRVTLHLVMVVLSLAVSANAQTGVDRSFSTRRLIPIRVVQFYGSQSWIDAGHPETVAQLTQSAVERAVGEWNIPFRGTGVQFYLRSFQAVLSDKFAAHDTSSYTWPSPPSSSPLLVFNPACDPKKPDGSSVSGLSQPEGEAMALAVERCSKPDEVVMFVTSQAGSVGDPPWAGKYINVDVATIGSYQSTPQWQNMSDRTASHELGHWLGLPHPYGPLAAFRVPVPGDAAGRAAVWSDFWDHAFSGTDSSLVFYSSKAAAAVSETSLLPIYKDNTTQCAPVLCGPGGVQCPGIADGTYKIAVGCGTVTKYSGDPNAVGLLRNPAPGNSRAKTNTMGQTNLLFANRPEGRDEHFFSESQLQQIWAVLSTEIQKVAINGRLFYSGELAGRTQLGETAKWGNWSLIGTGVSSKAALATDGTSVLLSARLGAGSVGVKVLHSDGLWWPSTSTFSFLDGYIVGWPANTSRGGGWDLTVVGGDSAVYTRSWTNATGWGGWTTLGGTVSLPIRAAVRAGALDLVVYNSTGVYNKLGNADGTWWPSQTGWALQSPWAPSTAPDLRSTSDGRIQLVRQAATQVEFSEWNGSWGPWNSIPNQVAGSSTHPPLFCGSDGWLAEQSALNATIVQMFANGRAYLTRRTGQASWSPWIDLGSVISIRGCTYAGLGWYHVFGIGAGGTIVEKRVRPTIGDQFPELGLGWTELGGQAVSELSSISRDGQSIELVVQTSSGELWHRHRAP